MTIYDDKTKGIVASGRSFILPQCEEHGDMIFKASYIVVPDIRCSGRITALFDLTVLGNIEAAGIDVKGKFICLGNCNVSGSIIVQNEIWANGVQAYRIESHDDIVAQEIDGNIILADGSIVVSKILAVEGIARSAKNILCGETAFGAGKVAANTIITGEPLDLDDGEDALESPNTYKPLPTTVTTVVGNTVASSVEPIDLVAIGETNYAPNGDFFGYLNFLSDAAYDFDEKAKFKRWQDVLCEATAVKQNSFNACKNIALLIWMAEISLSGYFRGWNTFSDLFDVFEKHFSDLIGHDKSAITCSLNSFDEWLEALSVLNRFRAAIDSDVFVVAFELVISNLGLKAKFVSERLNEKGWEAHGE